MTVPEEKKAGYITLKEAGERFGYSQDYLGQLIRKGKLEGKLVYSHVAWVTTPEAVEQYLAESKKKKQSTDDAAAYRGLSSETPHVEEGVEQRQEILPEIGRGIVIAPSRPLRLLASSLRVFLFLIILLGLCAFYLLTTLVGSALHAKTTVASASVVFSVPVVAPASQHHAIRVQYHE